MKLNGRCEGGGNPKIKGPQYHVVAELNPAFEECPHPCASHNQRIFVNRMRPNSSDFEELCILKTPYLDNRFKHVTKI